MCVCVHDFSGLDITYDSVIVKGNTLIIKDIVALGTLSSNLGKVISGFYFLCHLMQSFLYSVHLVVVLGCCSC